MEDIGGEEEVRRREEWKEGKKVEREVGVLRWVGE